MTSTIDRARSMITNTSNASKETRHRGSPQDAHTCTKAKKSASSPRVITHNMVKSRVGKLLFEAAILYEEMSCYTDEKLIERYLNHVPSLNPRRTLDQSYYREIPRTRIRDRDQVVYRGTAPQRNNIFDCDTNRCDKVNSLKKSKNLPQSPPSSRSDKPNNPNSHIPPCSKCVSNTTAVPRIIVVDQLWMWILNESMFLFVSLFLRIRRSLRHPVSSAPKASCTFKNQF